MLPIPGPLLVMQAMTALNEVTKSKPHIDTNKVSIAILKEYMVKNVNIELVTSLLILLCPIFKGTKRLGSVVVIRAFFR